MESTLTHSATLTHEPVDNAAYLKPEVLKEPKHNQLANLWLLLLAGILGLTLLCTGVLVAWPIISYLAS